MEFFIVIPAYRESRRLPGFLQGLVAALAEASFDAAILVVDDGSGAEEQQALSRVVVGFAGTKPQVLPPLLQPVNRGKGAAVRAGWKCAPSEAEWLVFVDADGAIVPSEMIRLLTLAYHAPRVGAFIGSRIKMLGRTIERSALRHYSGRIFASLTGLLVTDRVYDSQCGVKLVRAAAYRRVAPLLEEDGFCFDVELIVALVDSGAEVLEVAIDWQDIPGSKVSLFRDAWRMFTGLRRIRARRQAWALRASSKSAD